MSNFEEEEQQNNRRVENRRIGLGIDDDITEKNIVHPETFYPKMTDIVIDRVRTNGMGGATTTNTIRNDLASLHGIREKSIQDRIIYNVINDPRTDASIRGMNRGMNGDNDTMDYYVNLNKNNNKK
jgi:hypothetical protein